MKHKETLTYILIILAVTTSMIALSMQYVEFWWYMLRPYYVFWLFSLVVALVVLNINTIRRATYPGFVCCCAWLYKHKLIRTKFTKNTYKVYELNKCSYKKLYKYVQVLFDLYICALKSEGK